VLARLRPGCVFVVSAASLSEDFRRGMLGMADADAPRSCLGIGDVLKRGRGTRSPVSGRASMNLLRCESSRIVSWLPSRICLSVADDMDVKSWRSSFKLSKEPAKLPVAKCAKSDRLVLEFDDLCVPKMEAMKLSCELDLLIIETGLLMIRERSPSLAVKLFFPASG
jgi:hypothetical protein